MANIRILQLCAVDFTAQNFLRPLLRFLEAKGCEVTLACSRGPYFDSLRTEGFRLHEIEIRRSYDVLAHRRSTRRLTEYLRRERFDVIHVHTPIAALIGRIAATHAGLPIRLYTAHGFYFHDAMNPLLRRAHVALERYGGSMTDFLFTQSEEDRLTAIRERIIAPENIATIGNGIDLQRFSRASITLAEQQALRDKLGIAPTDQLIAVIGRLVKEKGYRELFDAMLTVRANDPDVRLLVIGQALESDRGGGKAAFAPQIEQLGRGVIFAGLRNDVPQLLSLAEVFTLPSWREGMPRSVIEAMAIGLPVVATNIRGCREEVVDGETGYLVPVRNSAELAKRLQQLLYDGENARAFGEAGRRRAESSFDERMVLQRQWQVYERLL